MNEVENEFLRLIDDYKASMLLAYKYLQRKNFTESSEREGYLDEENKIKYKFHGVGCLIEFEEFSIDFNFSENKKGFDPYFLKDFKDQFPEKYPLLKEYDFYSINDMSMRMTDIGLFVQPEEYGLFYLKNDWEA